MLQNKDIYEAIKALSIIDERVLEASLRQAENLGIRLDSVLIERDLVSEKDMGLLIADLLAVPYVFLDNEKIDKEVLNVIPEKWAKKFFTIAFKKNKEIINIASSQPDSEEINELLTKKFGEDKFKIFYSSEREIKQALFDYEKDKDKVFSQNIKQTIEEASKMLNEVPIIKLVDEIISFGNSSKVSDIHIEPLKDKIIVRFRIDGVLYDITQLPSGIKDQILSRVKVMAGLRTDEHMAAQDGKIVYSLGKNEDLDIRVSILPTINGEKIVMRLLSQSARQYTLSDLGIETEVLEKIKAAYNKPYGMILVTGPTGSGKTTTVYGVVKILNKREINITSIEDPVEYEVGGINQIQVNAKTNLTFADGLKSIVRQDPDVIFIGEIRDSETAQIAINAAMTGHLVLSTLHTNDAATTFPRLAEMGLEAFLIASGTNIVVAQRLMRKICTVCKISEDVDLDEVKKEVPEKYWKKVYPPAGGKKITFYKGKGCPVCNYSGYKGRIGIFEALEMTDKVRASIMSGANAQEIKEIAVSEGMITMFEDGLNKVKMGTSTISELLRVMKQ